MAYKESIIFDFVKTDFDVIIVGGGISGTALVYTLANYTNISRVALFEKHHDVAQVSSHYTQNSQTLHYGDIETNYTFEKAKTTATGARLVEHYLNKYGKGKNIFTKSHKMVIAVGDEEVIFLEERYKEFKKLFPKLKLITRKEIAKYEPNVVKGRDPTIPLIALWSPDGYTINYHELAKDFLRSVQKKKATVRLNTTVNKIERKNNYFVVHTSEGTYTTRALIVDAGGMSIRFAKMLGYGKHLTVFSMAGNFYRSRKVLNGKVYTVQKPKLPFAAVHGDPDVKGGDYTRYGPSAKPLFMLERWNYSTVPSYFAAFSWTIGGFRTVFAQLTDLVYLKYIVKNLSYDIPYFGNRWFAREAQKVVPSLKQNEITKDKGYGGTRPQIANTKTHSLAMGEARIEGEDCIFNITPSPGASTCLANAQKDTKAIIGFLGGAAKFDEKRFLKDLS